MRNMKVTVIPVVIDALEMVKGLVGLKIIGQLESIPRTLIRSTRILRRLQKSWGDLLHRNSSVKPFAIACVKNSQRGNNINGNMIKDTQYHVHKWYQLIYQWKSSLRPCCWWLVIWVLCHINLCRLFNAKSILCK